MALNFPLGLVVWCGWFDIGNNFEEAAGWRQIAGSEPSFEETIMFAAPVAAKAVKVLMRGAKPWGYFGLSAAAGVSAPYCFMLVSGGPAVREQRVVSSGHGLNAEPCLDAIVAGDGRDVFTFTSEGSLQTASGYCVRLAGDKLELEKCDSSTGVWEVSADGQVKQGNMCMPWTATKQHLSAQAISFKWLCPPMTQRLWLLCVACVSSCAAASPGKASC